MYENDKRYIIQGKTRSSEEYANDKRYIIHGKPRSSEEFVKRGCIHNITEMDNNIYYYQESKLKRQ